MPKDFSTMEDSNRSNNPSIHALMAQLPMDRRTVLRGAGLASLLGVLHPLTGCASLTTDKARLGFTAIPPGQTDALVVPPGYVAQVIARWGEPVGIAGNMPAFRTDGSNSAAHSIMTGNDSTVVTAMVSRATASLIP